MSRPSFDSARPALHPFRAWTFELDGLQHRLELEPDSIWWGRPPAFRLDGARTRMPMGLHWFTRRFEFRFSIAAHRGVVAMFLASAGKLMRDNLPKAFAGALVGGAGGAAAAVTTSSQWLFDLTIEDVSLRPPTAPLA